MRLIHGMLHMIVLVNVGIFWFLWELSRKLGVVGLSVAYQSMAAAKRRTSAEITCPVLLVKAL
jgi:hypothetical protein